MTDYAKVLRSYADARRMLRSDEARDAAALIDRLMRALRECAADWSSSPGTVMSAQFEINREFQRRMEIAGRALNDEQKETDK